MSISDCTVGEGNSAHFFRYFFLKPNDPLTQWLGEDRKLTESVSQIWPSTEYAKNLTEFVEEWPSVRIFSPSPPSSSSRGFSHRVRDRGIIFLTESFVRNSPSHRVHCRPPSPLPSAESRVFSPSDYFSHRVFGRKLTESPSPPSPPSHGFSHRVRDRVNFPESGGLTKMKWNKMKFEMLPVTIASLACIRNIFVLLFHCILSLSFISFISSRLYEVSWTKDRDECTAMTSLTWNQLLLQLSPR